MNIRTSLTFAIPSFLLLLGGCIIVDGNTGTGATGGSGGEGNSKTTSGSSVSTGSSMGGAGGQGTAGAGVGGGGGNCVGPEDGMLDVLSCDKLNTQATGNVCGPGNNVEPLANGTCAHGATIFQAGAFDVLSKCLQGIEGDKTNACDDAQVATCVENMYKAACPSGDAAATCDAISTNLCVGGEIFDTQGCLLDTNPLNTKALQEVADCISQSAETDCNKAYTACFAQVLSF